MKSLTELAALEESLLREVIDSYIEGQERHVAVERAGISHEYAAIVTGYVDLLSDPMSHAEALKRATFLVWYAVAEPSDFTGLSAITAVHTQRVMAALEQELHTSGGDDELRAMLFWYARVMAGDPFTDYPACMSLAHLVSEADLADEPYPSWRPTVTQGRGQMGSYWRSLRSDA